MNNNSTGSAGKAKRNSRRAKRKQTPTCDNAQVSEENTNITNEQSNSLLEGVSPINMAYSQNGFTFGQPFAQSPPGVTPTPTQGMFGMQTQMTPMPPPQWVVDMLDEIKQIKAKMKAVENIEKTVGLINTKVSDLEQNFKSLDGRIKEVEKSCEFISNENDQAKQEMSNAKTEIKELTKSCRKLEKNLKSMEELNSTMESKLTDLETRSVKKTEMKIVN